MRRRPDRAITGQLTVPAGPGGNPEEPTSHSDSPEASYPDSPEEEPTFEITPRSNLKNPHSNALFALSAPLSLWRIRYDWVGGPIPCQDLVINYRREKMRKTPVVQRINYLSKTLRKKWRKVGRKRYDKKYLDVIHHIAIYKGDLLNEEVGCNV